ncbi:MAG: beta-ketoacyl-[acyl-carrier-protein] synthase family protein [Bacteroidales bacterium]|jgi:3-oxoacyl-[acyl-carrier-protein] synthase-1|nr:beta-ketoacyl-[acyl-carrier-protein] synthase family protein [Bacteroidales bacterium]
MNPQILITGMGIITGLGIGKTNTLQALMQKQTGIGKVHYLQTIHKEIPVCEVSLTNEEMFQWLSIEAKEIYTRTALLGRIALQEALQEAEISRKRPKKIAFISGTTVGGMDKSEQYYTDFLSNNNRNAYIEMHDCGATTNLIAAEYNGAFDMMTTLSTACSSAANAIILGANLIKTGKIDAAIVGGSECLSKFHFNGFNTLMILDKQPCRPFDKTRAGLNLGEGAAYLVIESEESAKKRNITPICKLSGYANTCDAYHQTASSPNGEGAYLAMTKALKQSKLQSKDIDYINAHGTGTTNNDETEEIAIMRVFGNDIPCTSSTKSFTGHTTSAAGSVESVISILALQHNFIPVNLNFSQPMNEHSFIPATQSKPNRKLKHVLTNSFGFGGNDSACIFSRID